jgi:N-acetylmuramoyl-L-alanine amidase
MQRCMPCVGLIVLFGSFHFVVVPEPDVSPDEQLSAREKSALPTVVLDAGHGGNDNGASWNGLFEKNVNLDIAVRTERMLQYYNIPTVLTRRADSYVALQDRAAIANALQNCVFVSIHCNAHRLESVAGVETFYADRKTPPQEEWSWLGIFSEPEPAPIDNDEILAGFIQAALITQTVSQNRGIKSSKLYLPRTIRHPAVLVEAGFISNWIEGKLLSNVEYRERIAAAITQGILNYQKVQRLRASPPRPLASSEHEYRALRSVQ